VELARIWALTEAEKFYQGKDQLFSGKIKKHLTVTIDALDKWLNKENRTLNYGGYDIPAWLPYETGADQAAVIVKSFCLL